MHIEIFERSMKNEYWISHALSRLEARIEKQFGKKVKLWHRPVLVSRDSEIKEHTIKFFMEYDFSDMDEKTKKEIIEAVYEEITKDGK